MPRVLVAPAARDDLHALIRTHSLPPDTKARVARSLRHLERFPQLGRLLETGRWSGYPFVLGPWRWLLVLYKFDEEGQIVMVASLQDARSSTAATTRR